MRSTSAAPLVSASTMAGSAKLAIEFVICPWSLMASRTNAPRSPGAHIQPMRQPVMA